MINVVIARPYLKAKGNAKLILRDDVNLLLDSGAFTDHAKGVEYPVAEYIELVRRMQGMPCLRGYFVLDKVGHREGTLKNLAIMRDAGLDPIPIWTPSMTRDDYAMLQETSEFVGIGGDQVVDDQRKYWHWVMKDLIQPGDKVHLLGMGREDVIYEHSPFSVDASNHTNTARYGKSQVFTGSYIMTMQGNVKFSMNRRFASCARRMGFDVFKLHSKHVSREEKVIRHQQVSWASWVRYGAYIEHTCGTRFYQAGVMQKWAGEVYENHARDYVESLLGKDEVWISMAAAS